MTDVDQLLALYDDQLRQRPSAPAPGVFHEKDGPLLRIVGQRRGFIDAPRDLGLGGAELDALIARQVAYFAARGEAIEWKTRGHDLPEDLTDRLGAAGFVPEDRETVVIGEVAALAAEPVLPAGVVLRETALDEDMRRVAAMESAVWGEDWSWLADDLMGRRDAAPDDLKVVVAEAAGEVVCAAWLVLCPGTDFGLLWGGSTLAGWRGRGIYRAMVAARASLAAVRGARHLEVDASDDSTPILRRLGFHAVTTTTPYVWSPPGE